MMTNKDDYDHVLNCFKLSQVRNKELVRKIERLENILEKQKQQLKSKVSQSKKEKQLEKEKDELASMNDIILEDFKKTKEELETQKTLCTVLGEENKKLFERNQKIEEEKEFMKRDMEEIKFLIGTITK